jgi:uncharacterized membrane protein
MVGKVKLIIEVLGGALVVGGVGMLSVPIGLIVAGILIITAIEASA